MKKAKTKREPPQEKQWLWANLMGAWVREDREMVTLRFEVRESYERRGFTVNVDLKVKDPWA